MHNIAHRLATNGDTPAINQGVVHGWYLSWNPDDDRFYVGAANGLATATFSELRNAVQYARKHKPT